MACMDIVEDILLKFIQILENKFILKHTQMIGVVNGKNHDYRFG